MILHGAKVLNLLIVLALTAVVTGGCNKNKDPLEPLPGEPIKVVQPIDIISAANPGDEVPIELELLLPNPVDSLTATYLLNDAAVVTIKGRKYAGNSLQESYSATFEVPDSLPQEAFIRGTFVVTDVLDSLDSKSIKININN